MNQYIHRADQRGNARRRHEPCELKILGQPGSVDGLLQRVAQQSVADEQKSDVRTFANHGPRGVNHVFVPLQVKQPRDLTDDDVPRFIAECPASHVAIFVGRQKRFDIHAAVNRRELFARRDVSGDHQIRHRIGHADERVTVARRKSFARADQPHVSVASQIIAAAGHSVVARDEWRGSNGIRKRPRT